MNLFCRFLLLSLVLLGRISSGYAQSEAYANVKGSLVVNAGAGKSNFVGASIGFLAILMNNPAYLSAGGVNIANPSIMASAGPFSLSAEYRLFQWLSVGAEGIWSRQTLRSSEVTGVLPDGSAGADEMTMVITRPGAGLRLALHMGRRHPFLDPYLMGVAGARRQSPVSVSSPTLLTEGLTAVTIPWIRAGAGLRFITPVGLGGHLEAAIGGPLLSVGVSYCFPKH